MNVEAQVAVSKEPSTSSKNGAPDRNGAATPPQSENKEVIKSSGAAMVSGERFFTNQNITILLGGVTLGAVIGEAVWADPGKAAVVGIFIALLFILVFRKRTHTQKNSDLPD